MTQLHSSPDIRLGRDRFARRLQAEWARRNVGGMSSPLPVDAEMQYVRHGSIAARQIVPDAIEATLAAIRSQHSPLVVIAGNPGAGKSTTLRATAWRLAMDALGGNVDFVLPLYLDIGDISDGLEKIELTLLLQRELQANYCIDLEQILAASGRLVICLDTVDFPAGRTKLRSLLAQLAWFIAKPGVQAILAAQHVESVSASLNRCHEATVLGLRPLDAEAQDHWLAQAGKADAKDSFASIPSQIRYLLQTPFYLAHAISGWFPPDSKLPEPPTAPYTGAAGLIHGFVQAALLRAIREERIPRHVDFLMATMPMQKVCLQAALAGYTDRIPAHAVDKYLNEVDLMGPPVTNTKTGFEEAVSLASAAGLLHLNPEKGQYEFTHQSFAEYFAARHLANRLRRAAEMNVPAGELWLFLERSDADGATSMALSMLAADAVTTGLVREAVELLIRSIPEDAINLAAKVSSTITVPHLEAFANDGDKKLAAMAIGAIAVCDPTAAGRRIEAAWTLRDRDPHAWNNVAFQVNAVNPHVVAPFLARALSDTREAPSIRIHAALMALGGGLQHLAPLAAGVVQELSEQPEVPLEVGWALWTDPATLMRFCPDWIIALATGKRRWLSRLARGDAIKVLCRCGSRNLDPILHKITTLSLTKDEQTTLIQAITRRQITASLPWLWERFRDRGSASNRRLAMEAILALDPSLAHATPEETSLPESRQEDNDDELAEWRATAATRPAIDRFLYRIAVDPREECYLRAAACREWQKRTGIFAPRFRAQIVKSCDPQAEFSETRFSGDDAGRAPVLDDSTPLSTAELPTAHHFFFLLTDAPPYRRVANASDQAIIQQQQRTIKALREALSRLSAGLPFAGPPPEPVLVGLSLEDVVKLYQRIVGYGRGSIRDCARMSKVIRSPFSPSAIGAYVLKHGISLSRRRKGQSPRQRKYPYREGDLDANSTDFEREGE